MITTTLRIVKGDGTIIKVPFNMKKVSRSLTAAVLCEELINEISGVKKVKRNADETIEVQQRSPPGDDIVQIQEKLKQATADLDMKLIEILYKGAPISTPITAE